MEDNTIVWVKKIVESVQDGRVNPVDTLPGLTFWCGKTDQGRGCIVVPVNTEADIDSKGNLFHVTISDFGEVGLSLLVSWEMTDSDVALFFIEDLIKSTDFPNNPVNTFVRKQDVWKRFGSIDNYNRKFKMLIGLWGEMNFIRQYPSTALGWTGPSGTDRDIDLGKFCVEIKTSSSKSLDSITVSSASQLESEDAVIYVALNSIERSENSGFSLHDLYKILDLERINKHVLNDLEKIVSEIGDEFCNIRLRLRDQKILKVDENFPAITNGILESVLGSKKADRIKNLTYTVNISGLDEVDKEELEKLING